MAEGSTLRVLGAVGLIVFVANFALTKEGHTISGGQPPRPREQQIDAHGGVVTHADT